MNKKLEYETIECNPGEMFEVLNMKGMEGWEFINLIMIQKMIQNKFTMNQPPTMETSFKLIFKREKE
jgi:hypothetical protein